MSLEVHGAITVVMMVEGDFSNGLHGDMDFFEWIASRYGIGVVKNYSISLLGKQMS